MLPPFHLAISNSTIPQAGLGLFASHDMPAGTNLGLYPGVLVPLAHYRRTKLTSKPEAASYAWNLQSGRGVLDPTDPSGKILDVCKGGSGLIPLSLFLFGTVFSTAAVDTRLARINEPPAGVPPNVEAAEDTGGGRVLFYLGRDVADGEELFLDYGPKYDRSGYR